MVFIKINIINLLLQKCSNTKIQPYIKNLSKNTSNSFLKISTGSFHFNRLHHIRVPCSSTPLKTWLFVRWVLLINTSLCAILCSYRLLILISVIIIYYQFISRTTPCYHRPDQWCYRIISLRHIIIGLIKWKKKRFKNTVKLKYL